MHFLDWARLIECRRIALSPIVIIVPNVKILICVKNDTTSHGVLSGSNMATRAGNGPRGPPGLMIRFGGPGGPSASFLSGRAGLQIHRAGQDRSKQWHATVIDVFPKMSGFVEWNFDDRSSYPVGSWNRLTGLSIDLCLVSRLYQWIHFHLHCFPIMTSIWILRCIMRTMRLKFEMGDFYWRYQIATFNQKHRIVQTNNILQTKSRNSWSCRSSPVHFLSLKFFFFLLLLMWNEKFTVTD